MKPLAFLVVLCLQFAAVRSAEPQTQPAQGNITMEALRPLVTAAAAEANNHPEKTVDALDKAVRARWGEFDNKVVVLFNTKALTAILSGPYVNYRYELQAALRKMNPINDLPFEDYFTIEVAPYQIDSPDIEKIVVQRDGQTIEPLANELQPKEFATRLGGKTMLHAGRITYPLNAFAPNGMVTVTLIPASGNNIVTKLESKRLARLR
jgi:hypothetical protein